MKRSWKLNMSWLVSTIIQVSGNEEVRKETIQQYVVEISFPHFVRFLTIQDSMEENLLSISSSFVFIWQELELYINTANHAVWKELWKVGGLCYLSQPILKMVRRLGHTRWSRLLDWAASEWLILYASVLVCQLPWTCPPQLYYSYLLLGWFLPLFLTPSFVLSCKLN